MEGLYALAVTAGIMLVPLIPAVFIFRVLNSKGKAGETVWCEKCNSVYIEGKKSKDKASVEKALASK